MFSSCHEKKKLVYNYGDNFESTNENTSTELSRIRNNFLEI
jgi:hypothetical protein